MIPNGLAYEDGIGKPVGIDILVRLTVQKSAYAIPALCDE